MSGLAAFAFATWLAVLAAVLIGALGVADVMKGRLFSAAMHFTAAAFIGFVIYRMVQP